MENLDGRIGASRELSGKASPGKQIPKSKARKAAGGGEENGERKVWEGLQALAFKVGGRSIPDS